MLQTGFFDFEDRFKKIDEKDKLLELNVLIDWEAFRPVLKKLEPKRKNSAGRKRKDAVMMFKGLVLQHLYNLSDEELEYQIRDRYSFCRFLGLQPEESVPDANTFWDYRQSLIDHHLSKDLFHQFHKQLHASGIKATKGQIIDASFVDVPKQRNKRTENEQIKNGEIPDSFKENPAKLSQKDTDARWTKKNNETHYGYKNHINADCGNKIIQNFEVSSAEVHDSQVLDDILTENSSKGVYADSAYRSKAQEERLEKSNYKSCIIKKAYKNKPLTDQDKAWNKTHSKIRVRVEHVFGSMTNEQNGLFFKVIGKARVECKVGLMNLVYNMRRFLQIQRMSPSRI
tara:strand:- start:138 stop:1163 length:1026 start_codon:yes stop_codon:yes gene_type:complete